MTDREKELEKENAELKKRNQELQRQLARLEQFIGIDPLTGLMNKLGFDRRLFNETASVNAFQERRSGNERRSITVLAIDLKGFKQVNDTYGHPAGDQALMAVAKVMQAATRPGDVLARVGGDEFAAILFDADLIGAQRAAERILTGIRVCYGDLNARIGGVVWTIGTPVAADASQLYQAADALERQLRIANSPGGILIQDFS
jgi:diguanylate cyclase (GGDEF)-like protein